jgi:tetratricopeptide (TPR) repeat protein
MRKPSQAPVLAPESESTLSKVTPIAILDQLPVPNINSQSGKILTASLAKTRASLGDAKNWNQIGDAYAQLQRESEDSRYFDAAGAAYAEALRLSPNHVAALAGMAWVTGGKHQFDKSIEWGNQALAIDPQCIEALGIVGDAALEIGNDDLSFESYQKMMDLRPDLSSWSRGAHLLWMTGETNHAMMLMRKAINAGAPFAENTAWCKIGWRPCYSIRERFPPLRR